MKDNPLIEHLQKHAEALYDFADRICTLSSGALGLSITFRKEIIGDSPSDLWLLKTAWVAFAVSVVCCTAFRLSKSKAHWDIIQAIVAGTTCGVVEVGLFHLLCYRIGLGAFLLGITALVWFAGINVE